MKHLYEIIILCGLLIITQTGYSHTLEVPATGNTLIYKINKGTSIVLHGQTDQAAAYQWYKDSIRINGAIKKDYTASIQGVYSVTAFNKEGCPSERSDNVAVIVIPVISHITPDTVVIPPITPDTIPRITPDTAVDLAVSIHTNTQATLGNNCSYLLTAQDNSVPDGTNVKVTYELSPQLTYIPPSTADSSVSYNSNTNVITWNITRLKADDPMNLTVNVKILTSGTIKNEAIIKGKQHDPEMANNVAQVIQQVNPLIIPNVFTPNGDGVNDAFYIPGLDTYSETEISIMDRWGSNVYKKKNYQNDWTGNGLSEGTYFFMLKVKTTEGVWNVYKGYVTLLRSRM